jgi:hypothetical protein
LKIRIADLSIKIGGLSWLSRILIVTGVWTMLEISLKLFLLCTRKSNLIDLLMKTFLTISAIAFEGAEAEVIGKVGNQQ